MVGSLSSLILIYVGIQRLLAYSISDLNITKSNIKHHKHWIIYKILQDYCQVFFFFMSRCKQNQIVL